MPNKNVDKELSRVELEIKLYKLIENAEPLYSDENTLFTENFKTAPKEGSKAMILYSVCKRRGYISHDTHIRLTKEGALRLEELKDNLRVKEEALTNQKILRITLAVSAAGALFAFIQIVLSVITLLV